MGCARLARAEHCRDRGAAQRRDLIVAKGMMQPVAQQSGAHVSRAAVEYREQRRRLVRLGATQRFGQLEIATRRRVKHDVATLVLNLQALEMRERLASLGLRCVAQERPTGTERQIEVLGPESLQI